jgi:hypothetical protein
LVYVLAAGVGLNQKRAAMVFHSRFENADLRSIALKIYFGTKSQFAHQKIENA